MPQSAIENVGVDYCLSLDDIAVTLSRLAHEIVEREEEEAMSDELEEEADIAEFDLAAIKKDERPGVPSQFTCPECHGVLFEIDEHGLLRFRCRVGHAYSSETLLSEQSTMLEDALWTALRSLEENIGLARRLGERMRDKGNWRSARQFEERARELEQRVEVIRAVMLNPEVASRPQMHGEGDQPPESAMQE
jgi:two-component system chemotaxis response regulator CheB